MSIADLYRLVDSIRSDRAWHGTADCPCDACRAHYRLNIYGEPEPIPTLTDAVGVKPHIRTWPSPEGQPLAAYRCEGGGAVGYGFYPLQAYSDWVNNLNI